MGLNGIGRLLSAAASPSPTASASPAPSAAASASAETSATPLPTSFSQWVSDTFEYGFTGSLIYIAVVTGITLLVLMILRRTLRKRWTGNLRFFYNLVYWIVVILGVTAVLGSIRPLRNLGTAIAASSGIAGVIIGLAAQETLANLFCGMSIAAAKPFVVGQFIEILNSSPPISGTVEAIKLRHTILRDANNKQVVIPNSVMDSDVVMTSPLNEKSSPAAVNNNLDVGISYDSDIKKAMQIMSDLVAKQPQYVDTRTEADKQAGKPLVTVRVTALADSSVNLRAFVWTRTVGDGYQALSDLRYLVKTTFDREGIEIPYPCRNIVFKDAKGAVQTVKLEEASPAEPAGSRTEENK